MKVQQRSNWILALALLMAAVLYLGSLGPVDVSAEEELAKQPELLADYVLGQTVSIPQSTVLVDGQEHPADAVVYLPDGTAVTDSELVLTQTGIHTVQYKAKVDGWWYSDCVQFTVTSQPLSITGSPGSTYTYNADKDTVSLNLAQSDSFNFNHPISLAGKTANDPLISMYVTSQEVNVRDFEKIVVVLTDAYDPTNKVYIRLMGDWANTSHPEDFTSDDPNNIYRYSRYQSYVSANFDGGKTWSFWSWQAGKHQIVSSYGGGLAVYFSLCNEANLRSGCSNMTQEQDLYTLSYDAATNSLYHLGATPYPTQRLIADLDDPEFFDGQFKGFTNNEVYISVYADDVYTSANITVADIPAYSGSLNDKVADSTLPTMTVDCAPYTQTSAPAAIVGKPYSIFPATVQDINIYDDSITKEVFRNYGTENQTAVDLVDGAFTPIVAGEYAIVYSKADSFGNVSRQTVAVTAIEDAQTIGLQVSDFKATAGVGHSIAAPTVLSSDARTGRLTLTVTAERNETKETVYDGWLDEYTAAPYRFMMAGQWQVSFTVADHSQSATKTVFCQVDQGTSLIYDKFEELHIDKVFLTGSTYYLPTVKVVSFTDTEAIYTDAKIKINYAGKWQPVVSNRFTVTEEMGDFVLITYYDENNPDCEIYGTRSITNIGTNGSYQLSRLFITENAVLNATPTYLSFTAHQNASVKLLTKQNAENLSLVFQPNSKGRSFKSLSVLLTDSVDESIQLRITLENLATPIESSYLPTSYSRMYLNGDIGTTLNLQAGFVDSQKYYGLSYANVTQMVTCTDTSDSKNGLTAATCVNGEAFTGFPSGQVFITFEMEAAGTSELMLYSINSQSTSSFGEDFFSPSIAVQSSYASTYQINETVSTVTAQGIDVLNGYCIAQITVSRIGGGIVSTVDGRLIEKLDASKSYEFITSEFGEYVVYYYSKDASGNTNDSVYYSFYVEDVENPVIELLGGDQQTVWAGTEFVMPQIRVTDNRSVNMYPTVVIENPDGRRNAVSDVPYIFNKTGSYKVYIVVYDEEGNRAQVSYYVEVVENEQ